MARTDNLTNFLTDIADALRAKTDTEALIRAENFDTVIESIETGLEIVNVPIWYASDSNTGISSDIGYVIENKIALHIPLNSNLTRIDDYETERLDGPEIGDYIIFNQIYTASTPAVYYKALCRIENIQIQNDVRDTSVSVVIAFNRDSFYTASNILSSNIKTGINILGVNGTYTSDADATANDIINPKTAYIGGQKVTGAITPTYAPSTDLQSKSLTNTTGMDIYDLSYDKGYAIVGNRGSSSFYISKIVDDIISIDNSTQISLSDIDDSRNFTTSDFKFNYGQIETGIVEIIGCGIIYWKSGDINYWYELVFNIKYNIDTNTYSFIKTIYNDSRNEGTYWGDKTYFEILMTKKDTFMLRPIQIFRSNSYSHLYGPINRRYIEIDNINDSFTILKNFTIPSNDNAFNLTTTSGSMSNTIYIEYDNTRYRIYKIDNSYNFTLMLSGTDNATKRVALIGENYLYDRKLYSIDGVLLKDYSNILSVSTFKSHCEGFLFEIDTSTGTITAYTFNEEDYSITQNTSLTNCINSYTIGSTNVYTKPYTSNSYICSGKSDRSNLKCGLKQDTNILTKLNRLNTEFIDTSSANALASDILNTKTAYTNGVKITGSMPNNGAITITPTTSQQSIPAGYHNGSGVVEPCAITQEDYDDCEDLADNIISNMEVLPYTPIEYIQSTGTQYINTGIQPKSTIKVQTKFSVQTIGEVLVGFHNSESKTFRFFVPNTQFYLDYGSGEGRNRIFGGTCTLNTIYDIEFGNRYIKNLSTGNNIVSNSSVGSFTYSDATIGIFASGNGNYKSLRAKLYYCKIYDGETLVRDFIPVKDSNNVACLYDKVSETYFYNQGTGTFTAGNVIPGSIVAKDLQDKLQIISDDVTTNLLPENIKSGVSILGVSGNVIELNGETANVTPTTSSQTIVPTGTGKNALTEVTVNAVTSAIDNNIQAENIKKGITILGIEGTFTPEAIVFESVQDMEDYQDVKEDLYAIVYGVTYEGTYRYDNGNWVLIGVSSPPQLLMDELNEIMDTEDQYEGLGGTEEEIEEVLDDIIGTSE